MRSIPVAVTWEMLHRSRWYLLGALLFSGVFPAMVIRALMVEGGGFDPTHETAIVLHFCFSQLGMFIVGAAVFHAQGRTSRLYTFPISNSTIVVSHFIPGMLLMMFGTAFVTMLLNWAFHLGWPVWGPALFAAVAYACMTATLWLTEKSGWMLIGFTLAAFVLGLWHKSRYGDAFSTPDRLWLEVTPAEIAALVGFLVVAYLAAVVGVSINRRGEPLSSWGIVALIERACDSLVERRRPLKSAQHAHIWFQWRQIGGAMPIVVVFALVMDGLGWLIFNRDVKEVYPALLAGGGLLTAGGLVAGLFAGFVGSDRLNCSMGTFIGTRPMTTTELARITLRVVAQSVLLSWTIWLLVLVAVRSAYYFAGITPAEDITGDMKWWYYPATLLGPWITAGVVASMGMTGRATLIAKLFSGLMVAWIACGIASKMFLTEEGIRQLSIWLTGIYGVLFVMATLCSFIAAIRRSLIEPRVAYVAAGFVIAASLMLGSQWMPTSGTAISQYLFAVGAIALAVMPFASAPLALAWNRNR